MANIRQETRFELDRRELLSICEPGMQTIACETGELWITFDGSRQDAILRAGESLEVADGRGVVVSALRPARCVLVPRHPRGICLLDAGRGAWAAARRLRWRFPALSSLPSTQLR
jgi:hypothetical protein